MHAVALPHTTASSGPSRFEKPVDEIVRVEWRPRNSLGWLNHRIFRVSIDRRTLSHASCLAMRAASLQAVAPFPRERPLGRSEWEYPGLCSGLSQFRCIHIDLNLSCKACERIPVVTDLADIQSRAKHQKYIRVLNGEVPCSFADCARASAEEFIIGSQSDRVSMQLRPEYGGRE